MTRDEVIELAREAGLSHFYDSEGHCTGVTDARLCEEEKERNDDRLVEILSYFAALVAAHEREACAKVAKQWDINHPSTNYGGCIANLIRSRANG